MLEADTNNIEVNDDNLIDTIKSKYPTLEDVNKFVHTIDKFECIDPSSNNYKMLIRY